MSLSSLSALDGVKQEVQFNNISLDMIYCIRIVCWHKIWNHHLTAFGLRVDVVSDRSSRSGAKNAGSLGRVATRPKLSSFFHSSDTIALRLVLLTESLNIPFEYQFGILVTLFPPPPPGKKGLKKGWKVDQFHDRHFVRQGSKGSWKPGKSCNFILTFSRTRKSWKKKTTGPGKIDLSLENSLKIFLKRGTNPVRSSDFFRFFLALF